MDIAKLGKRYRCYQCKTLFYDLNRDQAICPKCGADQANAPKPEQRLTEPIEAVDEDTPPDDAEIVSYDEDVVSEDESEDIG